MSTLLHIVHPHTYKMHNDGIVIGHIPEYDARDQHIMNFIRQAVQGESRVLVHHEFADSALNAFAKLAALRLDEQLHPILEHPHIITLRSGEPIPDDRPERVSKTGWKYISDHCTAHSAYIRTLSDATRHVFIGGMFESCVTASALYCKHHLGKPVSVIEELCATWTPAEVPRSRNLLRKYDISLITPEDL